MKIDGKGRITIPSHFIKANKIKINSEIEMRTKYNSDDEVIMKFLKEDSDE